MKKLLYIALLSLVLGSCNRKNDYEDLEEQVLYEYLDMFLDDARRHGLNFDYVYDHKIELHFTPNLKGGRAAGASYAYNNNRKIKIFIDYDVWHNAEGAQGERYKKSLMYHELGHDIMGLDHWDGPIIMEVNTRRHTIRKRIARENDLSLQESYEYIWNELFTWYKQHRT